MSAVTTATLHEFRRRPGQDSLATLAEDALPVAFDERRIAIQVRSWVSSSKLTTRGHHVELKSRSKLTRFRWPRPRRLVSMTSATSFDVLTLTDEARNVVLDALSNEEMNATLALWVEVTGTMVRVFLRPLLQRHRRRPRGAAIGQDGEITS